MRSREVDPIHLTSWRIYLVLAIPTILAVPVPRNEIFSDTSTYWLLASLVGYLVIGLCLFFLRFVLAREGVNQRLSVVEVAFIGGAIGLVKGVTTGAVATFLGVGLSGWNEVLLRAVPATVLGAVIFGLLGLILTGFDDFRRQWDALVNERAHALELESQEKQELNQNASALNTAINQQLQSILQESQSALEKTQNSPVETQWQTLAEILRKTATEYVRPMSKELWKEQSPERPSSRHLLKLAAARAEVPVAIPPLIAVFAYIPAQFGSAPTNVFIREFTTYILFLFGTLTLGRLVASKVRCSRLTLLICIGLLAGLSVVPSALVVGGSATAGEVVANVLWITSLVLGTGVGTSLIREGEHTLQSLKEDAERARIEAAAAHKANRRMYRQLAQYLHGTVQSRLMASSLVIKSTTDTESLWFKEHLNETTKLISSPLADFVQQPEQDPQQAIDALVMQWDGIVSIETELDLDESISPPRMRDIVAVIQEAVANASRHGLAQYVKVQLKSEAGMVLIDVVDDGIGPRMGHRGLGSALFDEVGTWSIKPQVNGVGSHFHMNLQA